MKTQINFQQLSLKNGAKIILVKRPELYTAFLSGYFRAGSTYETAKKSGASHFVEHLIFRGSKKFESVTEIDKEIERMGLSQSAFTYYDKVNYHASFPPQEITRALRFCSSLIFESIFQAEEIEKERQVMLEEEQLREDDMGIRSWDLTLKTRLKDKNHPLILPREGLDQSIKTLKPKALRGFYKKHFHPANLTLVIGSPFAFLKLKKLVEKVFGEFSSGKKISPPTFDKNDFSSFAIATDKRPAEKTYLYFTFPAFSYDRPIKDRLTIKLLSSILTRIRLKKRLYQEKGLSYDWYAGWSVPAHPVGIFYLYSSCEPKNLEEIVNIFCQELKKLRTRLVSQAELERARVYFNKIQPMDFDTLTGAVDWFLDDFFYDKKFFPPEEIIKTRNKITTQNLFKIAKEIFNFSKLNVVTLGSVTQKELEKLVKTSL